jgi:hypothetical protein
MKRTGILWAMVAVLIMACAFYLYRQNDFSFWEDESWLAIAIGDGIVDVWTFASSRGVHPPLYFYMAFFLKPFIGDMEFALRWIGAMIALVGIAITYRLGNEVGGKRVGLYTAMILAGSFFLMYYTRLARQYSLFYTLSALTTWLYWRWQAKPSQKVLMALMLAQAANLYTHYFSAFLAVGIALHALLSMKPQKSLRVIAAFAGSGILFLPWLPSIWLQLHSDLGEGVYYAAKKLNDIAPSYLGRVTNDNYWLAGAMAVAGLVAIWRGRQWRLLLLMFLVLLTFVPIVIINQTLFRWYIGRNMFYTFPLVVLLYGMGLAHVSQAFEGQVSQVKNKARLRRLNTFFSKWRIGKITALAVVATFTIWGILAFPYFFPGTADWRGAMTMMAADARPSDLYVLDGEPYSIDYYMRRYLGTRLSLLDMLEWTDAPVLSNRIWLVDDDQAVNIEAEAVLEGMNYVQTRRIVRLPIVAELYQPLPEENAAIFGEQLALGYTGEEVLTVRRGETLILDIWWKPLRALDFNYSASFQIWGDGASVPITQTDGNFNGLDAQVLPLELWSADSRRLTIPTDAPFGEYTLRVTVYDWRDNSRLPVDNGSAENLFTLLRLIVQE